MMVPIPQKRGIFPAMYKNYPGVSSLFPRDFASQSMGSFFFLLFLGMIQTGSLLSKVPKGSLQTSLFHPYLLVGNCCLSAAADRSRSLIRCPSSLFPMGRVLSPKRNNTPLPRSAWYLPLLLLSIDGLAKSSSGSQDAPRAVGAYSSCGGANESGRYSDGLGPSANLSWEAPRRSVERRGCTADLRRDLYSI